ncbi:MAG: hypothetical protein K0S55_1530 [Clostridia bacterium]|nr:hypothetical protein [Clostridia bacterium]
MDKAKRKELMEKYKLMKPDMGLFIIRSKFNNKCYVENTLDIKSRINSTMFKLKSGGHPNRELQRDWLEHGDEYFSVDILEKLEYKNDDNNYNYSDDLTLLQMIWEEKLLKENFEFYKK